MFKKVALLSLFLAASHLSFPHIADAKKTTQTSEKTKTKKQKSAPIVTLSDDIDYSYGFDQKSEYAKFMEGDRFEVSGKTKRWFPLVNFHTPMPLNTSSKYDPKKRTLTWANPFLYSKIYFKKQGDPLDASALLLDWTSKKDSEQNISKIGIREQISFVLIPPQSNVHFLIGHAEKQGDEKSHDDRSGGGIQIRHKVLPKGTLVFTVDVPLKQNKSTADREEKQIDWPKIIKRLIKSIDASAELTDEEKAALKKEISMRPSGKIVKKGFYKKTDFYLEQFIKVDKKEEK